MRTFELSRAFGRIRARGGTRLDFLHRMSTGDLRGLHPGQGRATVLTTPIGRMVDHAAVLAEPDSLLLLVGGGNQARVLGWLRKYVFFNDDIQLADESDALPMWGVYGDGADAWAKAAQAGAGGWPRYAHAGGLVKAPPLEGAGYFLIGDKIAPPQPASDPAEYEALRIAAGYPAYPNEISEAYLPLEAGLWNAVSFTKGCYIGQEIIARMESRGRIARQLVRLSLDPPGAAERGDRLSAEGGEAGVLTSIAPGAGQALGYVRSAHAAPGTQLALLGKAIQARVAGPGGL